MISFGLGRELFAYGLGGPYASILPTQPTVSELVSDLIVPIIIEPVVQTTDRQTRRREYDKAKRIL